MLGFPVSRANFDRIAGMNSIESQCRQFILGALFSAQQTLKVSFDGQTLGSGARSLVSSSGWMLMLMCGHRPLREIVTPNSRLSLCASRGDIPTSGGTRQPHAFH
jgi:hypothetical protein